MSVEKQIILIFAVTQGYCDGIPVEKIKKYEEDLLSYLDSRGREVLSEVTQRKAIDDKSKPLIVNLLKEFNSQFQS